MLLKQQANQMEGEIVVLTGKLEIMGRSEAGEDSWSSAGEVAHENEVIKPWTRSR